MRVNKRLGVARDTLLREHRTCGRGTQPRKEWDNALVCISPRTIRARLPLIVVLSRMQSRGGLARGFTWLSHWHSKPALNGWCA